MRYRTRATRPNGGLIGLSLFFVLSLAVLWSSPARSSFDEYASGKIPENRYPIFTLRASTAEFKSLLSLHYNRLSQAPPVPEKETGRNRDDGSVLRKPPKKHGRATLELGGLILYSQTRYWLNYAAYVEDWQFHLTWKDQSKRFFTFQAWTFDSNAFSLNWTHGLAGVLYYQFARTNNLSWAESFLYALGGSLWWEYVTEWREVVSINDNIFTSIGGYAAGEAWYQLAHYFNSRKGPYNQLLGFINPVLKLNRWLDRKNSGNWLAAPEPGWHDFHVFVGDRNMMTAQSAKPLSNLFLGFHTWIIHIPEYGKPGKTSRVVTDTLASEMVLDFTLRQGGIEEANFATRITGLGYFNQDIDENGCGRAYFIGLGSAFSFFKKRSVSRYDSDNIVPKKGVDLHLEEPRDFRDKIAAVHIAGPVLDYTVFTRSTRLRLILDAYLDFGLVNAFALNPYSAETDISGIKTTLLYYGYYYGLGTTLSSGLTYNVHGLEFNGLLRYQAYGSLEGRDRFQDEVADDFHVKDSRLKYSLGAAVRIPGTRARLSGQYEGVDRRGTIKEIRRQNLEERVTLTLDFRF